MIIEAIKQAQVLAVNESISLTPDDNKRPGGIAVLVLPWAGGNPWTGTVGGDRYRKLMQSLTVPPTRRPHQVLQLTEQHRRILTRWAGQSPT